MNSIETNTRIEPSQQTAAKVAGLWYLVAMAAGIVAEAVLRGPRIVPGDAAQTAKNIIAAQQLFRLGSTTHLLVFAGDVVLIVALYVILKPVNRPVALLAALWRVIGAAVLIAIMLNDFMVVRLLSGAPYLQAFNEKQLHALARFFIGAGANGFQIGFAFLGLGSTVFSYVWLKSHYIPGGLALLGIFASFVLALGSLGNLAFPGLSVIGMSYMAPMFFYEVGLGLWLLIKGLR